MTGNQECEYRSLNFLVDDQGKDVIPFRSKIPFYDCKRICAQTKGCESFSLCDGSCQIKDKILSGVEPYTSKMEGKCFTTYKSCTEGTMFLYNEATCFILFSLRSRLNCVHSIFIYRVSCSNKRGTLRCSKNKNWLPNNKGEQVFHFVRKSTER